MLGAFPNAAVVMLPIKQRDRTIKYIYGQARSRRGKPRIDAEILAIGNALGFSCKTNETSEQFLKRMDNVLVDLDYTKPAIMVSLMNFCTKIPVTESIQDRRPCSVVVPPLLGNGGWFIHNVDYSPDNQQLAQYLLLQSVLYEEKVAQEGVLVYEEQVAQEWRQRVSHKINEITEKLVQCPVSSLQEALSSDNQVNPAIHTTGASMNQPTSIGREEALPPEQDPKRRKVRK